MPKPFYYNPTALSFFCIRILFLPGERRPKGRIDRRRKGKIKTEEGKKNSLSLSFFSK
jgi:hypothetical protein